MQRLQFTKENKSEYVSGSSPWSVDTIHWAVCVREDEPAWKTAELIIGLPSHPPPPRLTSPSLARLSRQHREHN